MTTIDSCEMYDLDSEIGDYDPADDFDDAARTLAVAAEANIDMATERATQYALPERSIPALAYREATSLEICVSHMGSGGLDNTGTGEVSRLGRRSPSNKRYVPIAFSNGNQTQHWIDGDETLYSVLRVPHGGGEVCVSDQLGTFEGLVSVWCGDEREYPVSYRLTSEHATALVEDACRLLAAMPDVDVRDEAIRALIDAYGREHGWCVDPVPGWILDEAARDAVANLPARAMIQEVADAIYSTLPSVTGWEELGWETTSGVRVEFLIEDDDYLDHVLARLDIEDDEVFSALEDAIHSRM